MYAAIFSRTYPMKSVAEVFAAAATDGYEGVQANLSSAGLASLPDTVPPGVAAQFCQEARAQGIRIAALSGTYNMAHPDASGEKGIQSRISKRCHRGPRDGSTGCYPLHRFERLARYVEVPP